MRPLSFRSQLLLMMVVPVLVTTGVLAWLAYGAARAALTEAAVRAVSIAASARDEALRLRLTRQRERAAELLGQVLADCRPGPQQAACLQEELAGLVATEGAGGARLSGPRVGPFAVGRMEDSLGAGAPLRPGQLARLAPGPPRGYDIAVQEDGATLTVRYPVASLQSLFDERYGLGRTGETFLADGRGALLTRSRSAGAAAGAPGHPLDLRPMHACLAGQDGEMLAEDERGVPVIHAYRAVEELGGGCILARLPQAEAFAPVRALRERMMLAAAALAGAALLASFALAQRLAGPVQRLTARARAMQAGDFTAPVPAGGPRELRTFSGTFASLARSLHDSLAERDQLLAQVEAKRLRLQVLADLSRALAESRLDFHAVLDTTCRKVAEVLGDVCLLRLLAADGVALVPLAVYGRDAALEARVREVMARTPGRLEPGLAEDVLRTGRPVLHAALGPAERAALRGRLSPPLRALLDEGPLTALMLLPLRVQERSVGVLALARCGASAPYTPADLTFAQEVADRAALALENARLYQEAQEAVRAREEVVGIVSHDLRNPLSAIRMSAELLLKRDALTEAQARGLGRIHAAADRAARLIRDLLDVSRARTEGGLPVSRRRVDLHALVRLVVEEVEQVHPGRAVHVETRGEGQAELDPDRVAQVLANLLGNALQHSPPGSAVQVASRAEDGVLLLEVHNEGPPIPPEAQAGLFEPFRRGAGAGEGGGSVGLGLFITRAIVQAHGGSISVRSSAGGGTTFTVRLPRGGAPREASLSG